MRNFLRLIVVCIDDDVPCRMCELPICRKQLLARSVAVGVIKLGIEDDGDLAL